MRHKRSVAVVTYDDRSKATVTCSCGWTDEHPHSTAAAARAAAIRNGAVHAAMSRSVRVSAVDVALSVQL